MLEDQEDNLNALFSNKILIKREKEREGEKGGEGVEIS